LLFCPAAQRYSMAAFLALDKACLRQAFMESGEALGVLLGRTGMQEPDHWHRRLLRLRRAGPCDCRAGEQSDELAASQLLKLHPTPTRRGSPRKAIVNGGSADMPAIFSGIWL
jgi:hypothetical protein